MRNLLLSTVTLLVVPAVALAAPDFPSHTHTTPIELEPISPSLGLKLASVCFLGYGDCGDAGFGSVGGDNGYDIDTIQQCKNEGFVNSCSKGYCLDKSCPYNAAYGQCLLDNCPENSATNCTGETVTQNNCGEDCKKCCSDTCPSGSKNYTGSYASTTECGTTCYNCNTSCPSGSSTSYSGTSIGTNECGQSCKKCNNACPAGYSTSTTAECYDTTTNECGNTCYKAKDCDPCAGYYECGGTWQYCEGSTCPADSSRCSTYCESDHFPYSCGSDYGPCYGDYRSGYCSVPCDKIETDPCDGVTGVSCSNGCASYGSCGQCTSCNPTPPSDPCEGVSCQSGVSCGSAGCASWSSSTSCCSSVCISCNTEPDEPDEPEEPEDPCDGLTNQSCTYGCQTYYSNCSSKCQTCYSDNCRNRTAVSVPSNATCTAYYTDCSSKCRGWRCNSGYTESGSSCVQESSGGGLCDGTVLNCGGRNCCCPTGSCYDSQGRNQCDCTWAHY